MNPTLLANIAVKVIAVYLISQGIMQVPSIVTVLQYGASQTNPNDGMLPILFATILSPMVLGIILWFISGVLSKLIVKGADSAGVEEININHIQAIAISIIGFILLIISIPQLISVITQLFGNMDTVDGKKVFNVYMLSFTFATAAKIILGLVLVMGVSGWSRLLNKIRGFGIK